MMAHVYCGVEDIALTETQREAVIDAFKTLGPASDPQPCMLCHWRIRADRMAAIFEARFNADDLTVEKVTNFLANATGADPANIHATVTQTAHGPVATFSAGGIDRLRIVIFAGPNAEWEESRQQTVAYIAANQAEWENLNAEQPVYP